MPQGDWGPNVTLRVDNVGILLGDGGILHIGVGFEVLDGSGGVLARSGWTWQPSDDELAPLQQALDKMLADLQAAEGVGLAPPLPAPPASP